jgi:mono/diheme cytochrome c family protein
MKYVCTPLILALVLAWPCGVAGAGDTSSTAARDLTGDGKAVYARQCARCHGFNMNNNGLLGHDLRKFPKDGRDRFVSAVVRGKLPKMPPWGDVLSADDIDALWAYVQTGGTP